MSGARNVDFYLVLFGYKIVLLLSGVEGNAFHSYQQIRNHSKGYSDASAYDHDLSYCSHGEPSASGKNSVLVVM